MNTARGRDDDLDATFGGGGGPPTARGGMMSSAQPPRDRTPASRSPRSTSPHGGTRGDAADVAIVVPVLGDIRPLRALLGRIQDWPRPHRETIVVTALANPELSAFCRRNRCRYLESVPCRGRQLDSGARVARADVLWFLHADACPYPSSLSDIAQALARGAEGGHFRFQFTGEHTRCKAYLERLINLRVRLGGIPYGDQGIFVRRDTYLQCGGFAHQPLFEEVALVRRLRARGRFQALTAPIGVSPRRWERDGWMRRSLLNRRLAVGYMCGETAQRLAQRYDPPNRSPRNRADGSPGP